MIQRLTTEHRLRNLLHTLLLIGGMALLLALTSELLFGDGVWPWVFAGVALAMISLPDISPHWILRLYRARRLSPGEAPQLLLLIDELSQRSGLEHPPVLYWIPSSTINAFAVGSRRNAAIAMTDGLLRLLQPRELSGVLAHELSHITSNDMRLMGLADVVSRLTHFMSLFGMVLILVSLPLMLLGLAPAPLTGLLLLIAAPTLSALLQLGLSRVREFDADLRAAHLTGDPAGLASALGKIEQQNISLWQRILIPGYRDPEPSVLRTHPDTSERIQRLLKLAAQQHATTGPAGIHHPPLVLPGHLRPTHPPRHRLFFRLWH
ncbi:MAG: zinc metalloprotease HtpX [Sedimenticola sp.]|nr:zinc metalloprotease HtpX [Sedimenticola sp.]